MIGYLLAIGTAEGFIAIYNQEREKRKSEFKREYYKSEAKRQSIEIEILKGGAPKPVKDGQDHP